MNANTDPNPDAPPDASGPPPPQPRLEFLSGARRDEVEHLSDTASVRIGSAPDCEITFPPGSEPFVSRQHARIRVGPEGAWIEELGSSNGTFVNATHVTSPMRLYAGDVVELGANGPHLRFTAFGNAFIRPLAKHGTIVLKKRKGDSPASQAAPAVQTASPWRTVTRVVVACMLAGLLVAAIAQRQTARQSAAEVADLQNAMQKTRKELDPQGRAAAGEHLASQYGPAVFLLALRVCKKGFETRRGPVPVGHLHPGGTAWAFDTTGRLVTNAHVVTAAQDIAETHAPHLELVAVQNQTGKTFRITDVALHPRAKDPETDTYRVSDVALLTLDGPVPVAFPLASAAAARRLAPGASVFSMGFPIEHLGSMRNFYGYDTPDRVVATLRHGYVQRVTGADGRRAPAAEQRLIHVGIAATGGQSGSPVFTRDGKAVCMLNAVAHYQLGPRSRKVPHPGMFTYAVRIDALWDMLEGTDASAGPPAAE